MQLKNHKNERLTVLQWQRRSRVSRSMQRVDFFRWQRQWCSDSNASTFCWSDRCVRWSSTFLTAMSITARMTLKSVSVSHTKDMYETHRSHDRSLAFNRCCNMSFEAKTTQQDSNSEVIDVGVVWKRSWKKVKERKKIYSCALWQWITLSVQQAR